jgi:putative ATP-dependent endonuclease of OLD family
MKICQLQIQNFRSVQSALLNFDGHTLLVGGNNIGKSTICEALDLALGPDRINRFPPVEEFDFYNGKYIGDNGEAIEIVIEVLLVELSQEVLTKCSNHLEYWNTEQKKLVENLEDIDNAERCLRLKVIASYDSEEDEFEAATYFSHSPDNDEGEYKKVPKSIKRLFGFLYLRTIRTGTRALSLERGSLLDIILRETDKRGGLWESTLQRLSSLDPPVDDDQNDLKEILRDIEKRLGKYVPLHGEGRKTRLHVSNLTREHLRKTLAFFLATSNNQIPVPFQKVGTGTLNTLVLALLSYIADLKKDNVIFAMEEPEIALPPHTQRRIVNYLLTESTQCFVTSHSPYVIESFKPNQIKILRKNDENKLSVTQVSLSGGLKAKSYYKNLRRIYAEAMLSKLVIVGEGITEVSVLNHVAERMEEENPSLLPLDLAGVTILSADTDSQLLALGQFFKSLGIPAFAFCDKNPRKTDDDWTAISAEYEFVQDINCASMEKLLIAEVSMDNKWNFLESLIDDEDANRDNKFTLSAERPNNDVIDEKIAQVLKRMKGEGGAARLLSFCETQDIPQVITTFLEKIYALYQEDDSDDLESEEVVDAVEVEAVAADEVNGNEE